MVLPRGGDHLLAEINTNAGRRLERRQQMARPASQIEHTRAFRNEKPHVMDFVLVVEPVPLDPPFTFGRHPVHQLADGLLARRECSRAGLISHERTSSDSMGLRAAKDAWRRMDAGRA